LPLRERAARLLIVGYRGRVFSATSAMAHAIDAGIGGVILFARNIVSPDQLSALTGAMRERAGDRPFLIAVDQEGGAVARLGPDNGFPATPSEAQLGEQDDPAVAQETGLATGKTLARMGINLNLAPVVDLNVNPNNPSIGALGRSFSADPDVVVELATALITGLHEARVLATLKHFPGLGSATGDTDREFVDVTATWTRRELEPFARLVADNVPDAVMVANALNGQLDGKYPSSLSAATVDVLRGQLGWDGVAITDDLQAAALRDSYPDSDIVRLALVAGNDLLLFANTQVYRADIVSATVDMIVNLVDGGQVHEARIDASVGRIERMLRRSGPG
jgi:beta-N-acetylhexosaminidase